MPESSAKIGRWLLPMWTIIHTVHVRWPQKVYKLCITASSLFLMPEDSFAPQLLTGFGTIPLIQRLPMCKTIEDFTRELLCKTPGFLNVLLEDSFVLHLGSWKLLSLNLVKLLSSSPDAVAQVTAFSLSMSVCHLLLISLSRHAVYLSISVYSSVGLSMQAVPHPLHGWASPPQEAQDRRVLSVR